MQRQQSLDQMHVRVLPPRLVDRLPVLRCAFQEAPGLRLAQPFADERPGVARARERLGLAGDPVVLGQREDREGVTVQVLAPVERLASLGRGGEPAAVAAVPEVAEQELEPVRGGRARPLAGAELGSPA